MSNYSIKLPPVELWRHQAAIAAAQGLRAAKVARLSPFDLLTLGGLGSFSLAAACYLIACAFGPVAGSVEGSSDWRPPGKAIATQAANPMSPPDTQTLARPLFEKSRRPGLKKPRDEGPAQGPVASDSPPAGMVLRGIAGLGDDTRVFIVTTAQLEGVWLKIGEKLEGWTVESVAKSIVVLKRGEREAKLEFDYAEAAAPAGPRPGAGFVPPPASPQAPKPQKPTTRKPDAG
ncbi:MAG TPA: hypothetical protein VK446_16645 [Methylocystis sp.]|nr:hypothetical protein [Methylocystis sp.]